MLNKELREVRELGLEPASELPAHLAGLPECLHKYGPLFAESALPEASRVTNAA